MKNFFKALLAGAALLFSAGSFAADMSNPYALANEVAGKSFAALKANSDKLHDAAFVNNLIAQELMPYVDIKYAAFKVIGTSLKNTTEQERNDFTAAFEQYLRRTLAETIGKYTTQELVESPVKEVEEGATMVAVKLGIREAGKEDIAVLLKFRQNNKTKEWKVFDLVAENISVLDAKTSELNPIIREKGIKAAIEVLESNLAENAGK